MDSEGKIYQRIGEFTVSFQWLENKLREIGWFILDPENAKGLPKDLRNLTNEKLINRVSKLIIEALQKCKLSAELEKDFKKSMKSCTEVLHQLRRDRNRILHSTFIKKEKGHPINQSNNQVGELSMAHQKFLKIRKSLP